MNADEELQRDVTRAALIALDGTAFALAGSGAIREHGITDRPTQDIDLFTSDVDAERFDAAVGSVIDELRESGHTVDDLRRVAQFARLDVTTTDGRFVQIDMGVDYREEEAVMLSVGPVLSLDDAVASKVGALYSRAEARDYLDLDAIRSSGKFTDSQLIDVASERDPGFELPMFITQLDGAQKLRVEHVEPYNVEAAQLVAIKERLGEWADDLRSLTSKKPVEQQPGPVMQRLADVDAPKHSMSETKTQHPEQGNSTPSQERPHTASARIEAGRQERAEQRRLDDEQRDSWDYGQPVVPSHTRGPRL